MYFKSPGFIILLVACAVVLFAFCSGHSLSKEKETVGTAEMYDLGENENFDDFRVKEDTTEDEMEPFGLKEAEIRDRRNTLYCVGTPYDPLYFLCCSGKVAPKVGGPKSLCCGTESYDSTSAICCQGLHIYPKQGLRPGCCGSYFFDAAVQLCCRYNVVPKRGSEPRCCGEHGYDASIERCCPGYVVVSEDRCPA